MSEPLDRIQGSDVRSKLSDTVAYTGDSVVDISNNKPQSEITRKTSNAHTVQRDPMPKPETLPGPILPNVHETMYSQEVIHVPGRGRVVRTMTNSPDIHHIGDKSPSSGPAHNIDVPEIFQSHSKKQEIHRSSFGPVEHVSTMHETSFRHTQSSQVGIHSPEHAPSVKPMVGLNPIQHDGQTLIHKTDRVGSVGIDQFIHDGHFFSDIPNASDKNAGGHLHPKRNALDHIQKEQHMDSRVHMAGDPSTDKRQGTAGNDHFDIIGTDQTVASVQSTSQISDNPAVRESLPMHGVVQSPAFHETTIHNHHIEAHHIQEHHFTTNTDTQHPKSAFVASNAHQSSSAMSKTDETFQTHTFIGPDGVIRTGHAGHIPGMDQAIESNAHKLEAKIFNDVPNNKQTKDLPFVINKDQQPTHYQFDPVHDSAMNGVQFSSGSVPDIIDNRQPPMSDPVIHDINNRNDQASQKSLSALFQSNTDISEPINNIHPLTQDGSRFPETMMPKSNEGFPGINTKATQHAVVQNDQTKTASREMSLHNLFSVDHTRPNENGVSIDHNGINKLDSMQQIGTEPSNIIHREGNTDTQTNQATVRGSQFMDESQSQNSGPFESSITWTGTIGPTINQAPKNKETQVFMQNNFIAGSVNSQPHPGSSFIQDESLASSKIKTKSKEMTGSTKQSVENTEPLPTDTTGQMSLEHLFTSGSSGIQTNDHFHPEHQLTQGGLFAPDRDLTIKEISVGTSPVSQNTELSAREIKNQIPSADFLSSGSSGPDSSNVQHSKSLITHGGLFTPDKELIQREKPVAINQAHTELPAGKDARQMSFTDFLSSGSSSLDSSNIQHSKSSFTHGGLIATDTDLAHMEKPKPVSSNTELPAVDATRPIQLTTSVSSGSSGMQNPAIQHSQSVFSQGPLVGPYKTFTHPIIKETPETQPTTGNRGQLAGDTVNQMSLADFLSSGSSSSDSSNIRNSKTSFTHGGLLTPDKDLIQKETPVPSNQITRNANLPSGDATRHMSFSDFLSSGASHSDSSKVQSPKSSFTNGELFADNKDLAHIAKPVSINPVSRNKEVMVVDSTAPNKLTDSISLGSSGTQNRDMLDSQSLFSQGAPGDAINQLSLADSFSTESSGTESSGRLHSTHAGPPISNKLNAQSTSIGESKPVAQKKEPLFGDATTQMSLTDFFSSGSIAAQSNDHAHSKPKHTHEQMFGADTTFADSINRKASFGSNPATNTQDQRVSTVTKQTLSIDPFSTGSFAAQSNDQFQSKSALSQGIVSSDKRIGHSSFKDTPVEATKEIHNAEQFANDATKQISATDLLSSVSPGLQSDGQIHSKSSMPHGEMLHTDKTFAHSKGKDASIESKQANKNKDTSPRRETNPSFSQDLFETGFPRQQEQMTHSPKENNKQTAIRSGANINSLQDVFGTGFAGPHELMSQSNLGSSVQNQDQVGMDNKVMFNKHALPHNDKTTQLPTLRIDQTKKVHSEIASDSGKSLSIGSSSVQSVSPKPNGDSKNHHLGGVTVNSNQTPSSKARLQDMSTLSGKGLGSTFQESGIQGEGYSVTTEVSNANKNKISQKESTTQTSISFKKASQKSNSIVNPQIHINSLSPNTFKSSQKQFMKSPRHSSTNKKSQESKSIINPTLVQDTLPSSALNKEKPSPKGSAKSTSIVNPARTVHKMRSTQSSNKPSQAASVKPFVPKATSVETTTTAKENVIKFGSLQEKLLAFNSGQFNQLHETATLLSVKTNNMESITAATYLQTTTTTENISGLSEISANIPVSASRDTEKETQIPISVNDVPPSVAQGGLTLPSKAKDNTESSKVPQFSSLQEKIAAFNSGQLTNKNHQTVLPSTKRTQVNMMTTPSTATFTTTLHGNDAPVKASNAIDSLHQKIIDFEQGKQGNVSPINNHDETIRKNTNTINVASTHSKNIIDEKSQTTIKPTTTTGDPFLSMLMAFDQSRQIDKTPLSDVKSSASQKGATKKAESKITVKQTESKTSPLILPHITANAASSQVHTNTMTSQSMDSKSSQDPTLLERVMSFNMLNTDTPTHHRRKRQAGFNRGLQLSVRKPPKYNIPGTIELSVDPLPNQPLSNPMSNVPSIMSASRTTGRSISQMPISNAVTNVVPTQTALPIAQNRAAKDLFSNTIPNVASTQAPFLDTRNRVAQAPLSNIMTNVSPTQPPFPKTGNRFASWPLSNTVNNIGQTLTKVQESKNIPITGRTGKKFAQTPVSSTGNNVAQTPLRLQGSNSIPITGSTGNRFAKIPISSTLNNVAQTPLGLQGSNIIPRTRSIGNRFAQTPLSGAGKNVAQTATRMQESKFIPRTRITQYPQPWNPPPSQNFMQIPNQSSNSNTNNVRPDSTSRQAGIRPPSNNLVGNGITQFPGARNTAPPLRPTRPTNRLLQSAINSAVDSTGEQRRPGPAYPIIGNEQVFQGQSSGNNVAGSNKLFGSNPFNLPVLQNSVANNRNSDFNSGWPWEKKKSTQNSIFPQFLERDWNAGLPITSNGGNSDFASKFFSDTRDKTKENPIQIGPQITISKNGNVPKIDSNSIVQTGTRNDKEETFTAAKTSPVPESTRDLTNLYDSTANDMFQQDPSGDIAHVKEGSLSFWKNMYAFAKIPERKTTPAQTTLPAYTISLINYTDPTTTPGPPVKQGGSRSIIRTAKYKPKTDLRPKESLVLFSLGSISELASGKMTLNKYTTSTEATDVGSVSTQPVDETTQTLQLEYQSNDTMYDNSTIDYNGTTSTTPAVETLVLSETSTTEPTNETFASSSSATTVPPTVDEAFSNVSSSLLDNNVSNVANKSEVFEAYNITEGGNNENETVESPQPKTTESRFLGSTTQTTASATFMVAETNTSTNLNKNTTSSNRSAYITNETIGTNLTDPVTYKPPLSSIYDKNATYPADDIRVSHTTPASFVNTQNYSSIPSKNLTSKTEKSNLERTMPEMGTSSQNESTMTSSVTPTATKLNMSTYSSDSEPLHLKTTTDADILDAFKNKQRTATLQNADTSTAASVDVNDTQTTLPSITSTIIHGTSNNGTLNATLPVPSITTMSTTPMTTTFSLSDELTNIAATTTSSDTPTNSSDTMQVEEKLPTFGGRSAVIREVIKSKNASNDILVSGIIPDVKSNSRPNTGVESSDSSNTVGGIIPDIRSKGQNDQQETTTHSTKGSDFSLTQQFLQGVLPFTKGVGGEKPINAVISKLPNAKNNISDSDLESGMSNGDSGNNTIDRDTLNASSHIDHLRPDDNSTYNVSAERKSRRNNKSIQQGIQKQAKSESDVLYEIGENERPNLDNTGSVSGVLGNNADLENKPHRTHDKELIDYPRRGEQKILWSGDIEVQPLLLNGTKFYITKPESEGTIKNSTKSPIKEDSNTTVNRPASKDRISESKDLDKGSVSPFTFSSKSVADEIRPFAFSTKGFSQGIPVYLPTSATGVPVNIERYDHTPSTINSKSNQKVTLQSFLGDPGSLMSPSTTKQSFIFVTKRSPDASRLPKPIRIMNATQESNLTSDTSDLQTDTTDVIDITANSSSSAKNFGKDLNENGHNTSDTIETIFIPGSYNTSIPDGNSDLIQSQAIHRKEEINLEPVNVNENNSTSETTTVRDETFHTESHVTTATSTDDVTPQSSTSGEQHSNDIKPTPPTTTTIIYDYTTSKEAISTVTSSDHIKSTTPQIQTIIFEEEQNGTFHMNRSIVSTSALEKISGTPVTESMKTSTPVNNTNLYENTTQNIQMHTMPKKTTDKTQALETTTSATLDNTGPEAEKIDIYKTVVPNRNSSFSSGVTSEYSTTIPNKILYKNNENTSEITTSTTTGIQSVTDNNIHKTSVDMNTGSSAENSTFELQTTIPSTTSTGMQSINDKNIQKTTIGMEITSASDIQTTNDINMQTTTTNSPTAITSIQNSTNAYTTTHNDNENTTANYARQKTRVLESNFQTVNQSTASTTMSEISSAKSPETTTPHVVLDQESFARENNNTTARAIIQSKTSTNIINGSQTLKSVDGAFSTSTQSTFLNTVSTSNDNDITSDFVSNFTANDTIELQPYKVTINESQTTKSAVDGFSTSTSVPSKIVSSVIETDNTTYASDGDNILATGKENNVSNTEESSVLSTSTKSIIGQDVQDISTHSIASNVTTTVTEGISKIYSANETGRPIFTTTSTPLQVSNKYFIINLLHNRSTNATEYPTTKFSTPPSFETPTVTMEPLSIDSTWKSKINDSEIENVTEATTVSRMKNTNRILQITTTEANIRSTTPTLPTIQEVPSWNVTEATTVSRIKNTNGIIQITTTEANMRSTTSTSRKIANSRKVKSQEVPSWLYAHPTTQYKHNFARKQRLRLHVSQDEPKVSERRFNVLGRTFSLLVSKSKGSAPKLIENESTSMLHPNIISDGKEYQATDNNGTENISHKESISHLFDTPAKMSNTANPVQRSGLINTTPSSAYKATQSVVNTTPNSAIESKSKLQESSKSDTKIYANTNIAGILLSRQSENDTPKPPVSSSSSRYTTESTTRTLPPFGGRSATTLKEVGNIDQNIEQPKSLGERQGEPSSLPPSSDGPSSLDSLFRREPSDLNSLFRDMKGSTKGTSNLSNASKGGIIPIEKPKKEPDVKGQLSVNGRKPSHPPQFDMSRVNIDSLFKPTEKPNENKDLSSKEPEPTKASNDISLSSKGPEPTKASNDISSRYFTNVTNTLASTPMTFLPKNDTKSKILTKQPSNISPPSRPTAIPRRRPTGLPLFSANIITQLPFRHTTTIRRKTPSGDNININMRLFRRRMDNEDLHMENSTDIKDPVVSVEHAANTSEAVQYSVFVEKVGNNESESESKKLNANSLGKTMNLSEQGTIGEYKSITEKITTRDELSVTASTVVVTADITKMDKHPSVAEFRHASSILFRKLRSTRMPYPTLDPGFRTTSEPRKNGKESDIKTSQSYTIATMPTSRSDFEKTPNLSGRYEGWYDAIENFIDKHQAHEGILEKAKLDISSTALPMEVEIKEHEPLDMSHSNHETTTTKTPLPTAKSLTLTTQSTPAVTTKTSPAIKVSTKTKVITLPSSIATSMTLSTSEVSTPHTSEASRPITTSNSKSVPTLITTSTISPLTEISSLMSEPEFHPSSIITTEEPKSAFSTEPEIEPSVITTKVTKSTYSTPTLPEAEFEASTITTKEPISTYYSTLKPEPEIESLAVTSKVTKSTTTVEPESESSANTSKVATPSYSQPTTESETEPPETPPTPSSATSADTEPISTKYTLLSSTTPSPVTFSGRLSGIIPEKSNQETTMSNSRDNMEDISRNSIVAGIPVQGWGNKGKLPWLNKFNSKGIQLISRPGDLKVEYNDVISSGRIARTHLSPKETKSTARNQYERYGNVQEGSSWSNAWIPGHESDAKREGNSMLGNVLSTERPGLSLFSQHSHHENMPNKATFQTMMTEEGQMYTNKNKDSSFSESLPSKNRLSINNNRVSETDSRLNGQRWGQNRLSMNQWQGGVVIGEEQPEYGDSNVGSLSSSSSSHTDASMTQSRIIQTAGSLSAKTAAWHIGEVKQPHISNNNWKEHVRSTHVSDATEKINPLVQTGNHHFPVVPTKEENNANSQGTLLSGISAHGLSSSMGIHFGDNVVLSVSGYSGGLSQPALDSGTVNTDNTLSSRSHLQRHKRSVRSRASQTSEHSQSLKVGHTRQIRSKNYVVDAQDLCHEGELFTCFGKRKHSKLPGIEWWCVQNCRHGNCPLSKCKCGCQKHGSRNLRNVQLELVQRQLAHQIQRKTIAVPNASSNTRRTVWKCKPTTDYAPVSGLGEWCNRMCSLNACPTNICDCS